MKKQCYICLSRVLCFLDAQHNPMKFQAHMYLLEHMRIMNAINL